MNKHRFNIGQKIISDIKEEGRWGEILIRAGTVVNLFFLKGQPAYEIKAEYPNIGGTVFDKDCRTWND